MILDATKIEILVSQCVETMLTASDQGFTFDSIELLPFQGIVNQGDGDGINYHLWMKDAQGQKVIGRVGYIPISLTDGIPLPEAIATLKNLRDKANPE